MDVPRSLDLRNHNHVQLVADLGNDGQDIIEDPRAVEAVDARPQRRVPELVLLRDFDQALPRRLLVRRRNGVLEVPQQYIDPGDELRDLRADLLVLRRKEMNHAIRSRRDLTLWRGRADREWPVKRPGVTHLSGSLSCERDYIGLSDSLATARFLSNQTVEWGRHDPERRSLRTTQTLAGDHLREG